MLQGNNQWKIGSLNCICLLARILSLEYGSLEVPSWLSHAFNRLTFYLAFQWFLARTLVYSKLSHCIQKLNFYVSILKRKEMPYNYCDISILIISSIHAKILKFQFQIFVGKGVLFVFWKTDVTLLSPKVDNYCKKSKIGGAKRDLENWIKSSIFKVRN